MKNIMFFFSIFVAFIKHLYVYICMWEHHDMGADTRRQLEIVCSLLTSMNPRFQTQIFRLGSKHDDPLSYHVR